ncbi:ThuA domain-containing protein [Halioxenophilus aromaticivorans]|uniref:ThuA-like domain-containing protein n=1 Tax=Halioxenophilus aromaticivorans TaxID=1306992 RepID=A0AAV3U359_9ALTE
MNLTPVVTRFTKKLHRSSLKALIGGTFALAAASNAFADKMLDCPLRDEPFTLNTPFLDILLSEDALAVFDQYYPGARDKMPPIFVKTETPAFGAIIAVGVAVSMGGDPGDIDAFAADLAKVQVTDADRKARCARYSNEMPEVELPDTDKTVLVFTKINGFDHGPSVTAATEAVQALAEQQGWGVVVTDQPGIFTTKMLKNFDAVVWNNNSGDVLTLSQRKAFEKYITNGGGFVGVHGAGGDSSYYWDFYANELLGAQFIGHPMEPQFQTAKLNVEAAKNGVVKDLAPGWSMKDEWYSFAESPRNSGADVVVTIDESSYDPGKSFGKDLHMGEDHPIVWSRCIKDGRAFYTAIGHRKEVYNLPEPLKILRDGIAWAMGEGEASCK